VWVTEKVVAGASMSLAINGIAYLGTTAPDAQGNGYHAELIYHRIKQARKHGCHWVAVTALPAPQASKICNVPG
jgi:GNAT superfamily N-acetyltransferase